MTAYRPMILDNHACEAASAASRIHNARRTRRASPSRTDAMRSICVACLAEPSLLVEVERSPQAARTGLAKLSRRQLIAVENVTAIVQPPLESPLAVWQPGDWVPDFGSIAWQLANRWQKTPELLNVYFATRHAANIWGGKRKGSIPQRFQVSHDLVVAEMLFAILRCDPALLQLWIDEERLAPFRRGVKLPNGVLGKEPEAPSCVLEVGGHYSKARMLAFHED